MRTTVIVTKSPPGEIAVGLNPQLRFIGIAIVGEGRVEGSRSAAGLRMSVDEAVELRDALNELLEKIA